MPTSRRQLGFTLLELLVSISLAAVVLMILASGLLLAEGAWRRGTEREGVIEQNLAENEAIQAQMGSAVPRVFRTQQNERPLELLSFRGDAKQVRYLSRYSWEGERNSGLWLASYRVVRESDGKEQLLVSETGLTHDQQLANFFLADELSATRDVPFNDPADHIEISYLRSRSPGKLAAWVEEWKCEEQKELPRGVRIHWQSGKRGQDLQLVIPVMEPPQ